MEGVTSKRAKPRELGDAKLKGLKSKKEKPASFRNDYGREDKVSCVKSWDFFVCFNKGGGDGEFCGCKKSTF